MTDKPTKPQFVVCFTNLGDLSPIGRSVRASSWQEAARLAYEASQRFPSLVHWVERAQAQEPAPTVDPRDALIAQMREALEAHVEAHGKSRLAAADVNETPEDADRAHDRAMAMTYRALAKAGEPT